MHIQSLHTYMHTWHVQPLHRYMHMCASNPCTLICTSIYIFPRTHPSRIQQQGLYPECILSAEAPQDQATLLTGVTVTLLPALGLSPEARDEGNRPSFSESLLKYHTGLSNVHIGKSIFISCFSPISYVLLPDISNFFYFKS